MTCERYWLKSPSGVVTPLPPDTRPAGEVGVTYDRQLAAGGLADEWHVEGTGKPVPTTLSLTMTIIGQTEQDVDAQVELLTRAAAGAVALERDGAPSRALLGLQSSMQQPLQGAGSRVQALTLTLLPAAPGQIARTPPGTTVYTPGTRTVLIDGVPVLIPTWEVTSA